MPSSLSKIKVSLRRGKVVRVGTLITPRGLNLLSKKKCAADCVEVRIDHLLRAGLTAKKIARALSARKHPVLLTLRSRREGGVYRWKAGERTALTILFLSQVEAIDLEINELSGMALVLKSARKLKKEVVLSAHSIKKPVTNAQLKYWIKKFRTQPALYYKIAGRINQPSHLQSLANILKKYPRHSWALMGLGPDAPRSRTILSGLGSCAVYGYLDRPAAAGQPALRDLGK